MHDTALIAGMSFSQTYGQDGMVVLDIGGKNVNGSLREYFESRGMKFISIDMEAHPSVDIVVQPGEKLPFEDGSFDLIVSTSCFEHDPCFWLTFREMTRIVKLGGAIYVNAPSDGPYHKYPGDNWRFYSDAGQALAYWSGYQASNNETVFPVEVVETFNILGSHFNDFVCVWKRVEEKQTQIIVQPDIEKYIGPLETTINQHGFQTRKKR